MDKINDKSFQPSFSLDTESEVSAGYLKLHVNEASPTPSSSASSRCPFAGVLETESKGSMPAAQGKRFSSYFL